MIHRKSSYEIAKMREAGRLVAEAHLLVQKTIIPGLTTLQLDQNIESFVKPKGGQLLFKGYKGFPQHICTSINEEIVHGVPSNRKLKEGDIISVDIGIRYHGYVGDSAWTYPVGTISNEAQKLLNAGEIALAYGIKAAQHNNYVSDISKAIQTFSEGLGYSVVRDYAGHGVGIEMHEEPKIPNFIDPTDKTEQKLKLGLVIAIEPMLCVGSSVIENKRINDWDVVLTKDHSLSCHFEHTIAITENGPQILTVL